VDDGAVAAVKDESGAVSSSVTVGVSVATLVAAAALL